ncbi:MAG: FAD-dependent oxidoreductase [Bacteroidales bacterium]|jgi:hypothetical protein|nr:FAD-dependent oxidoreductase [Bacteroidales bacterium]
MDRKRFISLCSGAAGTGFFSSGIFHFRSGAPDRSYKGTELTADLVIAGGGLGGCAAALSALKNNLKVIMTEETDWIGGQISQQGVPPDEHQWIETHGGTLLYRSFRNMIRQYYRRNYPLTAEAMAKEYLNPGDGSVSRLCHEPRVALAVLNELLAPYISSRQLILLTLHKIEAADVDGNRVKALKAIDTLSCNTVILSAPYFIDATEMGDLLPITGTEYVTGAESRHETRELHAPEKPDPENNQAFTVCFAMDYLPGGNYVIEKPRDYDFWVNYKPVLNPPWPGRLLDFYYSTPSTLVPKELGFNPEGFDDPGLFNLWNYRRIINRKNFSDSAYEGDITIVNWPQNDFMNGNLIDADPEKFNKLVNSAKQLSLSLLYWLQTEAPRPDKGYGWPGLRLRPDIMGTSDGLAKYPYVRESRRIKAVFTVLEEHVGRENRSMVTGKKDGRAAEFFDSVGTGYYHIDLHPSSSGDNYIDFDSLPFQIPLGSLIPVRMENLIPANKNIGTTHITNGCYRLHPVEWNIGESAGMLIAFALAKRSDPRFIRENRDLLEEFRRLLVSRGIETKWPE